MLKPAVGSTIVYIVYLVYAVHVMTCTKNTDWESAMHVFSWLNCEFLLLYYVCVLEMSGMYL